jgi:hypothetical protein
MIQTANVLIKPKSANYHHIVNIKFLAPVLSEATSFLLFLTQCKQTRPASAVVVLINPSKKDEYLWVYQIWRLVQGFEL